MTELSDAATRTLVRATRYAGSDARLDATVELGELPEDELDAVREVLAFIDEGTRILQVARDARAAASKR
jgi:hypothetical protein